MVSDGDTVTYSNGNTYVDEDISGIDQIEINTLRGGAGGAGFTDVDSNYSEDVGGYAGELTGATANVSEYDTLRIWIPTGGNGGARNSEAGYGGRGRVYGGSGADASDSSHTTIAGGGGSAAEIFADGNKVATAGGGGGGGVGFYSYGSSIGNAGGGGAAGGPGGEARVGSGEDGGNAQGTGVGGDGGDVNSSDSSVTAEDVGDGGVQQLIASGGSEGTGGEPGDTYGMNSNFDGSDGYASITFISLAGSIGKTIGASWATKTGVLQTQS
jgi:hypothetical protein